MNDIEGPSWDDVGGELAEPILTCIGCKSLMIHDFHYYFCSAQGGEAKYWTKIPVIQLYHGYKPNSGCPFPVPPKPSIQTTTEERNEE